MRRLMHKFVSSYIVLAALLLSLTSPAMAQKIEGQADLSLGGIGPKLNTVDYGNYQLTVFFKEFKLKYRLFSLLNEPAELFSPRYIIKDIYLKEKNSGKIVLAIQVDEYMNEKTVNSSSPGSMKVSQDIMNRALVTKLHFILNLCATKDTTKEMSFNRINPGVLFRGGKWGFDVAGSPSWSKYINKKYHHDNMKRWVSSAVEWHSSNNSKSIFKDMRKRKVQDCGSFITKIDFDIGPLISAILAIDPSALENGMEMSDSDKQMMSLAGQYARAVENKSPDRARRKRLTERAFKMLEGELSNTTKTIWNAAKNTDKRREIIEKLNILSKGAEQLEKLGNSKEIPENLKKRFLRFGSLYSTKDFEDAGIPAAFLLKINELANLGMTYEGLKCFRKNNQNGGGYQYGVRYDGGNLLRPQFAYCTVLNKNPNRLEAYSHYSQSAQLVGVIDARGNIIIPFKYNRFGTLEKIGKEINIRAFRFFNVSPIGDGKCHIYQDIFIFDLNGNLLKRENNKKITSNNARDGVRWTARECDRTRRIIRQTGLSR